VPTSKSPEFTYGVNNLASSGPSVVTIGAFDGIHLGHQAIMSQAVKKARAEGLTATALILEPLPREYFSRDEAPPRILPLREKVEAIFGCGIDRVVCLRFNAALSALSPEDFVKDILVEGLAAREIIVGEDFRFGSNRAGNHALMAALAEQHGFEITLPDTVEVGGDRVSSTRIRQLLRNADFAQAATLLGRPFAVSGRVCPGKQMGRQLGVPTANIALRRRRSPVLGTFAVKVDIGDQIVPGVANVGVRPTINRVAKPQLETHLFDFNEDLYGRRIHVEFCLKLREEQRFHSVDALREQIQQDIAQAKEFFNIS